MRSVRWTVALALLAVSCRVSSPFAPATTPPSSDVFAWTNAPAHSAAIRLEAPGGSRVQLQRLDARIVREGPLAYTELQLEFESPELRAIETTFDLVLPARATVTRFAMMTAGRLMEGEVLAPDFAAEVYEGYRHGNVDPGVLDLMPGNHVRGRVFPALSDQPSTVIVGYVEEVPGPYVLPVSGLGELERLSVHAVVDGRASSFEREQYAPEKNLRLTDAALPAIRSGSSAAIRLDGPKASPPGGDAVILLDTSASTNVDAAIEALQRTLADFDTVRVVCFDQTSELVYRGDASGFGAPQIERIRARGAMGATDLGLALRAARRHRAGASTVVFMTDGVHTAGHLEREQREAAAASLGAPRVLARGFGRGTDERTLSALRRGEPAAISVTVPGARWWWPKEVRAGESIVVYATAADGEELQDPLSIRVGGEEQQVMAQPGTPALLQGAIAAAELRERLAYQGGEADAVQRRRHEQGVVDLSARHQMLSPLTSYLVLESDAAYARHGIVRGRDRTPPPSTNAGPQARREDRATTIEERIEFRSGSADIEPASEALIDEVAGVIEQHPRIEVEVSGFGDDGIGEKASLRLSRRRAKAVMDALIARGIAAARLRAKGYGSAYPIATRETAEGRAKNRRVEFAITRTGYPARMRLPLGITYRNLQTADIDAIRAFVSANPTDRVGILLLAEALRTAGAPREAARAIGSLLDLGTASASDVRTAAIWLEALDPALSLSAYRLAVELRPDQPTGHRLLAYALAARGRFEEAFSTLEHALEGSARWITPAAVAVAEGDLELLAAAWIADDPEVSAHVRARLAAFTRDDEALTPAHQPVRRYVLSWESDASDVDLDLQVQGGDPRELPCSPDIDDGYGPECVEFDPSIERGVGVYFERRGPMGPAIGTVHVVEHDGRGHVEFEQLPFIITEPHGYVDAGRSSPEDA